MLFPIVFVATLALPSVSLAAEKPRPEVANRTTRICDDYTVTSAGNDVFTCLDQTIQHKLNIENADCDNGLQNKMEAYASLANKACYKKKLEKLDLYAKLVDYSLNHAAFTDFVQNKGKECISAASADITVCVTQVVGKVNGTDDKYHNLWLKSHPYIEKPLCEDAHKLKLCVLKAIRDKKCPNSIYITMYVDSLFEYMLEECVRHDMIPFEEQEETAQLAMPSSSFPGAPKTDKAVKPLLGVILALLLLGMLYVLCRDCCAASRGRWNPTQAFQMKSRRRSLVNNEAGQNH